MVRLQLQPKTAVLVTYTTVLHTAHSTLLTLFQKGSAELAVLSQKPRGDV
jgi:hypothetical protein